MSGLSVSSLRFQIEAVPRVLLLCKADILPACLVGLEGSYDFVATTGQASELVDDRLHS